MTARRAAWITGSLAALCVAILLADYAIAGPKSTTAARLARKHRDNIVAWILIATGAAFVTTAKRAVPAPPLPTLAPLRANPAPRAQNRALVTIPSRSVEEMVAQTGRGKEAAIPLLQAVQSQYRYLPDDVLRRICELTEITPAELAGTSSFYARFRRAPVGEHVVRVCHGTACHVAGARAISDELRRSLAIPEGADTDVARQFTLEEVACLGCCSLAPVMMVDGQPAGKLTPATACQALRAPV